MKQFNLLIALCAICTTFLFTSCEKEDTIVDTWYGVKAEYYFDGVLEKTEYFGGIGAQAVNYYYTFNENGTYSMTLIRGDEPFTQTGTYSLSADKKTLILKSSKANSTGLDDSVYCVVRALNKKDLVFEMNEPFKNHDGETGVVVYYFSR